jgi:rSAM/selenodomain-associated transferase 2
MSIALSVVIPALDEAACIGATLQSLAPSRARGVEIIVVDGGSTDATRTLAAPWVDRVIEAPNGRSTQLNAGAQAARGRILLFLHADTQPPDHFDQVILSAVRDCISAWGRFDVAITGKHRGLKVVSFLMNLRSRATGIATGDQGIFVTRQLFDALQGFPAQPLMEDIEFSKRAKRRATPICLRETLRTSGRRWERNGLLRTILLMWRLRLAYFLGTDPAELRRRYANSR